MLKLYKIQALWVPFGQDSGWGSVPSALGLKLLGNFQKLVQYRSGSLESHDHIDPFPAVGTTVEANSSCQSLVGCRTYMALGVVSVWIHEFVAFLGFSLPGSLKHLKYSARYTH